MASFQFPDLSNPFFLGKSCWIYRIWPLIPLCTVTILIQATVSPCPDYYSSFLTGLPASSVFSLWPFFSITARVILLKYVVSYTLPFWTLHWLPLSPSKGQILYEWPRRPSCFDSSPHILPLILVCLFLLFLLFYPHWPPCCASDIQGILLPQSLWTCWSFYLTPSFFQVLIQMSSS